jgi:hypothetical protein
MDLKKEELPLDSYGPVMVSCQQNKSRKISGLPE